MNPAVKLMTIKAQLKKAGITITDADDLAPPTIEAPTRAEIVAAITAAHNKGEDPAADPTVQKLTTAHVLAGLTMGAELAGADSARQLQNIHDRRGEILNQLTEAFNQHAAMLADLAPSLGPIRLEAGTTVEPPQAPDFTKAYQANQAIEGIREAWGAIHDANGQHRNPLTICQPTRKQWDAERLTINSVRTAWELIGAGIELTLAPNLRALAERAESIQQQEQALIAEHEEAYRESNRRAYAGITVI